MGFCTTTDSCDPGHAGQHGLRDPRGGRQISRIFGLFHQCRRTPADGSRSLLPQRPARASCGIDRLFATVLYGAGSDQTTARAGCGSAPLVGSACAIRRLITASPKIPVSPEFLPRPLHTVATGDKGGTPHRPPPPRRQRNPFSRVAPEVDQQQRDCGCTSTRVYTASWHFHSHPAGDFPMWRSLFIAMGLFLMILGMECLAVDRVDLRIHEEAAGLVIFARRHRDRPAKRSSPPLGGRGVSSLRGPWSVCILHHSAASAGEIKSRMKDKG